MIPDANLGWLFTEVEWPERFAAAAAAGFTAVEMPWPPLPAAEVAERLADHGLASVLVNVPVGAPGEDDAFGWACWPDAVAEFRSSFTQALEYAELCGTRFIHVLAGLCPPGLDHDVACGTYADNISWALGQVSTGGPTLLVEAINRRDNPHFLLSGLAEAAGLVRSIDDPCFRLLFDTHHCGVENLSGVTNRFAEVRDIVGHIQLGDAPDRVEPGAGLIEFDGFFSALRALEWRGYIAGEYRPTAGTAASLGWRGRLLSEP